MAVLTVEGDLDPVPFVQPALQELHLNLGQAGGEHLHVPIQAVGADGIQRGQSVDLGPRPGGQVMAALASGGPIMLGVEVDGRRTIISVS
ncbi:MAG: hypothetical protein MUO38_00825 [Anaerolineales bacterium]|nr:hypothetical protein [Anaerolineales bacterium]